MSTYLPGPQPSLYCYTGCGCYISKRSTTHWHVDICVELVAYLVRFVDMPVGAGD